jgi:omega-amidase
MLMSTLTITGIQTDLQWEDKTANLGRFREKILGMQEPTEIVVLPEMFSTGFSMKPEKLAETMDGPTMTWMKSLAAEKRIILTGSIIIEENGRFFNRMIWMLPNGQYGLYDKRHRFAYAGEDGHYSAGNRRLVASVKGWRILLQVCYDLRFPVWSRQSPVNSQRTETAGSGGAADPDPNDASGLEYDCIIYVANWPERRNLAWKTLLQARAIENQSYVVGVNRVGTDGNGIYHSGDSSIFDPLGELLVQESNKETIFTHTFGKERLDEVRSRFPFWRDGDHFSIDA